MIKLIVIVMVMVMGLAVAAGAAVDDTWMMQLRAYNGTLTAGTLTLGTKVGATDAYTTVVLEDGVWPSPPADGAAVIISTIVPGQSVIKDVRAPLTSGQIKTWDLLMYIQGGGIGNIKLDVWMGSGTYQLNHSVGAHELKLEVKQGTNTLWAAPYDISGSSSAPLFTVTSLYDGNPISLQLVASVVPEPSSIIALLGGLAGLLCIRWRRA